MRVLIVGGGAAGWITASRLDAAFNRDGRSAVEISVVEAPDIGRIGVGEATIPTVHRMLQAIGIDETEFLTACDATYKLGIRFDDWSGVGARYWHPFHRLQNRELSRAGLTWLNSDGATPFAGVVATSSHLLIVFASRYAPASVLAPLQYLEIVAATIYGYLIFGDFMSADKWLGVAIIIGSGLFIFWRERRLSRSA